MLKEGETGGREREKDVEKKGRKGGREEGRKGGREGRKRKKEKGKKKRVKEKGKVMARDPSNMKAKKEGHITTYTRGEGRYPSNRIILRQHMATQEQQVTGGM